MRALKPILSYENTFGYSYHVVLITEENFDKVHMHKIFHV